MAQALIRNLQSILARVSPSELLSLADMAKNLEKMGRPIYLFSTGELVTNVISFTNAREERMLYKDHRPQRHEKAND
jgi:hypothetical protein